MSRVGEIRHVPETPISRQGAGSWFVVEEDSLSGLFGRVFVKAVLPEHDKRFPVGCRCAVDQCDPVPDDQVPEWVLVELTKFRLSQ